MNNGKNPNQPGEGNKKPFFRPGQRHGGHNRGGGQQGRGPREASAPGAAKDEPKRPIISKDCAICGKPIFDLAGAVGDKDSGEPVHFDCAFERVVAAETLEAGEKIVYLGAGCFGVVAFKTGNDVAFVVKRRIRWEKEGEKQPWRKEISSYITKI
jgi:hypothetical protein